MYFKTIAFVAAVAATPVIAQTGATTPAPKLEKVKKTCREEMATGSMFAKRTCHTADEWKAIDSQNEKNAQDALSRRSLGRPS